MNSGPLKIGNESLAVGEVSARYRSSAVNSPSVPPGYKQTEVGVIPDDWGFVELKNRGRVIDSLHQTPSFIEDGYAMVRVTDIKTGNLCLSGALRVSESIFAEFTKNYRPKRGDIVLSRVGSYGISSFVDTDEPFCMGQNTVVIESKLPARFLYYVLNSQSIKLQIEDESYGSGYKSLSLKNIKELLIPLPPTDNEQRAIAAALSDVDALLAKLDQLIAKKRDLKLAAMQQLLTGQIRLPGFRNNSNYTHSETGLMPEEWDIKNLGSICDVRDGTHESPKFLKQGIPFITSKNIIDGHLDLENVSYISEHDATEFNKRSKVDRNDILMSMIGTIGSAVLVDQEPSFCIKNVALIKPKKVNPFFLIQLVNSTLFQQYLSNNLDGGIQKFIALGTLRELTIPFPGFEEQTAIATILSDMDAEIAALETRRDKSKDLKQGMMQELLTGRIRLI